MGAPYRGTENLGGPARTTLSGANLLLRWDRPLQHGARLSVQPYLAYTGRDVPQTYGASLSIYDAQARDTYGKPSCATSRWPPGDADARIGACATARA